MSGSAFEGVQVSSLVKGFFLTDSRRDIIFITLSTKELYLELATFFYFTAFAVPKCVHL